jgi:hypothetical protein
LEKQYSFEIYAVKLWEAFEILQDNEAERLSAEGLIFCLMAHSM